MRLSYKTLKKYTVKTVSGTVLGRVRDVVFDTESQSILQYIVAASMGFGSDHMIHQSQVVRFEDGVMVVEDTAQKTQDAMESSAPLPNTKPILMREE